MCFAYPLEGGDMRPEDRYKLKLIDTLHEKFPGCFILRLDAHSQQGIPDFLILYKTKWATLEVKANENAPHEPNQDYYVDLMDNMSFSAFIYPENEEEVLDELQRTFSSRRTARVPRRK
jgi:hypothetical protein